MLLFCLLSSRKDFLETREEAEKRFHFKTADPATDAACLYFSGDREKVARTIEIRVLVGDYQRPDTYPDFQPGTSGLARNGY